jgi:Rieske Fe-S protein
MIERRLLLKGAIALGLGRRLHARTDGGQPDGASARPQENDVLVRADDASKRPLTPEDIPLGAMQTIAWAMNPAGDIVRSGSRLNQIVLLRLDIEKLAAETRARSANGVVAYTAICTHTGCEVGDWLADEQLLSCPCHFSTFDPRDGGKVVEGPAPRMLPALPLKIVDGKLVVARPFTAVIGFEKG